MWWFDKGIMAMITMLFIGIIIATTIHFVKKKPVEASGAPEKDYYTINRGNLTYEVDIKYQLCFARRGGNSQLVVFSCPMNLLQKPGK